MNRRYWPKTFFSRSVLILISPVILMHIISGYVFFHKHWEEVGTLLSENIAVQVSSLLNMVEKEGLARAKAMAKTHYAMELIEVDAFPFTFNKLPRFRESLSLRLAHPYRVQKTHNWLMIWVKTPQKIYYFCLPSKRLAPRSMHLFLWWAMGSSLVFLLIAIVIMGNQIRPLRKLVRWSQAIAQNHEQPSLSLPTIGGAREIRNIALALQAMVIRLRRNFTERNQMLAGISHDLRTPLARMKVHLQLLPENQDVRELRQDVEQMIAMTQSYLTFIQQGQEAYHGILLYPLLQSLYEGIASEQFPLPTLILEVPKDLWIRVQPTAFTRCMQNLLDNSVRYAVSRIRMMAFLCPPHVRITLEDDGPGIPENLRESVFFPFFRGDESRHLEPKEERVGLGLSIVKNIVLLHGGSITLDDSSLGGARFTLEIPLS